MRTRLLAVLLVGLSFGVVGCSSDNDDQSQAAPNANAGTTQPAGLAQIPDIVDMLQPSVVAVLVEGAAGQGEGSGVVWNRQGVVVTNRHVVVGAQTVRIQLASGERVDARVRATDALSDLAVLATGRDDLVPARFASELPRVGELAIALGNPLGFEQTATQGIVSGLNRSLPGGGEFGALVDLIQTDAAISPGNSGGALVNAEGEVIGINVAYVPPAGGAVSIGFAIPSPTVQEVVEELLADGRATHAYLGIRSTQLTPPLAEQLGIDRRTGVLVVDVEPGSPGDEGGLRRSDVIASIAGRRVEGVEDLLSALRRRKPGDRVEITILRAEGEQTLEVVLGIHPGAD